VDLGCEGSDLGAGEDCRAHDQMPRQSRVNATSRIGHSADSFYVRCDVAIQLGVGHLGKSLDLEALVGVFDVDRQQAADVRVVDLDALDLYLAVLAEEMHLVTELS